MEPETDSKTLFYGIKINNGETKPFVPTPDFERLHLSQACMPCTSAAGVMASVFVTVKSEDESSCSEKICICTLQMGLQNSVSLDIVLDHYTEIEVVGSDSSKPVEVHLSGYLLPPLQEMDQNMALSQPYLRNLIQDKLNAQFLDDYQDGDYDEDDDDDSSGSSGDQHASDEEFINDEDGHMSIDLDQDDSEDSEDDDSDDEGGMFYGNAGGDEFIVHADEEDEDQEHDVGDDAFFKSKKQSKSQSKNSKSRRITPCVIKEITKEDEQANGAADQAADQQPANNKSKVQARTTKHGMNVQQTLAPVVENGAPSSGSTPKGTPKGGTPAGTPNGKAGKAGKEKSEKGEKSERAGKRSREKNDGDDKTPPSPAPKSTPNKKQKQQNKTPDKAAANASNENNQNASNNEQVAGKVRRFENGFEIHTVKQGSAAGKVATSGKRVCVKYEGKLSKNGKVFDKNLGKGMAFRLGVGEVIKGWDRGVQGMRPGEVRKLVIPPQMAYGQQGVKGTIPPNATLEFNVELVSVK